MANELGGKLNLKATFGRFPVVNYNDNCVKVGTGFNMEERKNILDNANKFIGTVAEIKYFEVTKDGKSLRHPVFSRWRDDK